MKNKKYNNVDNRVVHGYPQCNSLWAWQSSGLNDQRFHYGIDGLFRPKYRTKYQNRRKSI